ncbi:MAG TPA: hypothetical protein VFV66_28715, partial [Nonomuraea sp.]|nr:hypothetical protein [Nonomuraea sp.]
ATFEENDTSCCYALQDKVWVHGPGAEPWEVYVVKGHADTLATQADSVRCATADAAGEAATAEQDLAEAAAPGSGRARRSTCC